MSTARRVLFMLALVVAGEGIFALCFVVPRIFRVTLLDVFGITNLQLGTAFSLYGLVAVLVYFPGGTLADRFPARRLMASAILATAAGGVYYATVPALGALTLLYAFWGLTTILLFWGPMIRAAREWGGDDEQGRAYGILDGGRGLFAALLASVTVAIFGALLPEDAASATLEQRTDALVRVIWIVTGMTLFAGVLVWLWVPERPARAGSDEASALTWARVKAVLRNPTVWLQGMIVITAYTGYKGFDDIALVGRDVFGFDDVEAAQVGTIAFWVRPVAALGAGLIGDRIGGSRAICVCFVLMIAGDLPVALGLLDPSAPWMLFTIVVGTGAGVYGLRGLYFAIFGDAGVPRSLTGTAVGLVSVIGYTPDIFMGPLNGYLTDTWPGPLGHQYFFGALTGFAVVGLVCTLLFQHVSAGRKG